MYFSIPAIILAAGVIMLLWTPMKIKGAIATALGVALLGLTYVPFFTPVVRFVNGIFS